jgi:hypothetical protein
MNEVHVLPEQGSQEGKPRKTYASPTLVLLGQVAALTQQASGCDMEDNGSCNIIGGGRTNPAMPFISDRRAKENIERVGDHALGFGLYRFNYRAPWAELHGAGLQFGVMADEVSSVVPDAVSVAADGYQRVDYAMLGIRPALH